MVLKTFKTKHNHQKKLEQTRNSNLFCINKRFDFDAERQILKVNKC